MNKIIALTLLLPLFAASISNPLAELAATERKFSDTCGKIGVRDSFLEFFADDVVTFGAGVNKGKAQLRQLPAHVTDGRTLSWEPVYGDISLAGDLGYTTGPYLRATKTGPVEHGMFFSIWKRQSDGAWKVVLDAGLLTPKPDGNMGREFQPAPRVQYETGFHLHQNERVDLALIDRRLGNTVEKEGLSRALSVHGDSSLRLHRAGFLPIMGAQQVTRYLEQHPVSYKSEPLGWDVSSSGDLGFVYGSYESLDNTRNRGFYVRVWRRNEKGEWRVVLDSMQSSPTK